MVKRSGFSLIEVMVAMVLLAIALLAIAGTTLLAARTFAEGELREQAGRRAAAMLDSLVLLHASSAGERVFPGYHVGWSADTTRVSVQVRFANGEAYELEATP